MAAKSSAETNYCNGDYLKSLKDGYQCYKARMHAQYINKGIPWPFKETENISLTQQTAIMKDEKSELEANNPHKIITFGFIRSVQKHLTDIIPNDVINICYIYYYDGIYCQLSEFKLIDTSKHVSESKYKYSTHIVMDPYTHKLYEIKAIYDDIESKKEIIREKKILQQIDNQFICKLYKTFADSAKIYFVLDGLIGVTLFQILRKRRYFDEKSAKFYAACVIEAFAYLHSKDIIYRNLKPETIMVMSNGYVKLTDFVLAKRSMHHDDCNTICGTPDYFPPEMVHGLCYGKGADWWTVGILIYEMCASFPPFVSDECSETYRKIVRGRVRFPRYFTQEVRDLIRGLIRSKPTKRLGMLKGGVQNVRKHTWYDGFKWQELINGILVAPCSLV